MPRDSGRRVQGRSTFSIVFGLVLLWSGVATPLWGQVQPNSEDNFHTEMLELRQHERRGDRKGAIRIGEKLLKSYPENRRVEDALLHLYRLEKRNQDIRRILEGRLQRDPDDLQSTRELAGLWLGRGDRKQALSLLETFVDAKPKDENRYRMAAQVLRSHQMVGESIRFYHDGRKAIGEPSLFAFEVAQLEEIRGNHDAAIGEYVLLAMVSEHRVRAWRKISGLLERSLDPAEVLSSVDALRRRHSESPAVQDVAAMVYLKTGRMEDALEAIRKADRHAEDEGDHLLEFGREALKAGRVDAGADSRGLVSVESARVGVKALQLLVERHPKSSLLPQATRLVAEGLVRVADSLSDPRQRDELLEESVQAIDQTLEKLGPSQTLNEALAFKALILFDEMGRPKDALQSFERLAAEQKMKGEPDEVVRVQIALCKAALGELEAARSILEELLAEETKNKEAISPKPGRRPRNPREIGWTRARFHMAELEFVAGRHDIARDYFSALAEEAPEDRLANDCLDLALVLNESASDDPGALKRLGGYMRARLVRDRDLMKQELEQLVQDHPLALLAPVALFELGKVYEEDRKPQKALVEYGRVLENYSEHRLASRALEARGDLQLQALSQPDRAVASYEQLLLDYPDDLFLDTVRKKLVAARKAARGLEGSNATP